MVKVPEVSTNNQGPKFKSAMAAEFNFYLDFKKYHLSEEGLQTRDSR